MQNLFARSSVVGQSRSAVKSAEKEAQKSSRGGGRRRLHIPTLDLAEFNEQAQSEGRKTFSTERDLKNHLEPIIIKDGTKTISDEGSSKGSITEEVAYRCQFIDNQTLMIDDKYKFSTHHTFAEHLIGSLPKDFSSNLENAMHEMNAGREGVVSDSQARAQLVRFIKPDNLLGVLVAVTLCKKLGINKNSERPMRIRKLVEDIADLAERGRNDYKFSKDDGFNGSQVPVERVDEETGEIISGSRAESRTGDSRKVKEDRYYNRFSLNSEHPGTFFLGKEDSSYSPKRKEQKKTNCGRSVGANKRTNLVVDLHEVMRDLVDYFANYGRVPETFNKNHLYAKATGAVLFIAYAYSHCLAGTGDWFSVSREEVIRFFKDTDPSICPFIKDDGSTLSDKQISDKIQKLNWDGLAVLSGSDGDKFPSTFNDDLFVERVKNPVKGISASKFRVGAHYIDTQASVELERVTLSTKDLYTGRCLTPYCNAVTGEVLVPGDKGYEDGGSSNVMLDAIDDLLASDLSFIHENGNSKRNPAVKEKMALRLLNYMRKFVDLYDLNPKHIFDRLVLSNISHDEFNSDATDVHRRDMLAADKERNERLARTFIKFEDGRFWPNVSLILATYGGYGKTMKTRLRANGDFTPEHKALAGDGLYISHKFYEYLLEADQETLDYLTLKEPTLESIHEVSKRVLRRIDELGLREWARSEKRPRVEVRKYATYDKAVAASMKKRDFNRAIKLYEQIIAGENPSLTDEESGNIEKLIKTMFSYGLNVAMNSVRDTSEGHVNESVHYLTNMEQINGSSKFESFAKQFGQDETLQAVHAGIGEFIRERKTGILSSWDSFDIAKAVADGPGMSPYATSMDVPWEGLIEMQKCQSFVRVVSFENIDPDAGLVIANEWVLDTLEETLIRTGRYTD